MALQTQRYKNNQNIISMDTINNDSNNISFWLLSGLSISIGITIVKK